ncbi:MAG TPA: serine O-acetyltransferase EpsC [Armatimonadota bacterium]|nr:serine O-acetyltransferase EpsC [Armatimonadota bacterium]
MIESPSSSTKPVLDAALIERTADQIKAKHNMPSWHCPDSPAVALPSAADVFRILARLDEVFFPCFRSRPCTTSTDAEGVIQSNLEWLYQTLSEQILRALPFRWLGDYAKVKGVPACDDLQGETDCLVTRFFSAIPGIRDSLMLDVEAAYEGDPAAPSYAEVILSYPGLRAITVHRIAHELYRLDVPLLPRIMSEHVHSSTGIDIHPGARIGNSFFIDHGTGVVIGETTEIGDRVKIFQGVTLGAQHRSVPVKGTKRHPTIGNDVIVYAGATLLGDIRIGARSIVGGNVWLTESVEPDSFVIQEHHQLVKVTARQR